MTEEPNVIHLGDGKLADDTPLSTVKDIVGNALGHTGPGGIVIHFHGGLVNYDKGMEIANTLHSEYTIAHAFPIFFIWEAGLIETLENNFREISREKFFKFVWKRISKIVKRKFAQSALDKSVSSLPFVDVSELDASIDVALEREDFAPLLQAIPPLPDEIEDLSAFEVLTLENELAVDIELVQEIEHISNSLRTPQEIRNDTLSRSTSIKGSTETMMDPTALDKLIERPEPGEKGIISTAKMIKAIIALAGRTIVRFRKDRDHGFHATIVEEILRELYLANAGEFIWSLMKKDTADAFGDDSTLCGGTALLTELKNRLGDGNFPKITLVGHSTGAIYISEFLDKAEEILPGAKFNVIYLAPAATFMRIADTVERHADRVSNIRMFTMEDACERNDRLVKYLYPHSLLYFISGVLEGGSDVPIVGMHRYYDEQHFSKSEFPNVEKVREYMTTSTDRVVWSVKSEGGQGMQSTAKKHGDFDNDPITLKSIKHILSSGF